MGLMRAQHVTTCYTIWSSCAINCYVRGVVDQRLNTKSKEFDFHSTGLYNSTVRLVSTYTGYIKYKLKYLVA